jgi:hypothetical protein
MMRIALTVTFDLDTEGFRGIEQLEEVVLVHGRPQHRVSMHCERAGDGQ